MDLNRNYFLFFKTIIAGSALLFQIIAIKYLGEELTGTINQLQLYAMSVSLLILPGLELALIRFLPIEKESDPLKYKTNMICLFSTAKIASITSIMLILFYYLLRLFYDDSHGLTISIIVFSLALILFNSRIVPLLFRIERNMLGSIFTEPGIVSVIAIVTVIFTILFSYNLSSALLLSIPILFSGILSLWLLNKMSHKLAMTNKIINFDHARNWTTLIKQKYSYTFILVSASNFSILWGLAAIGSVILPPEDVAIYVTILRFFSVLIFVEGAIVAYYLPSLVNDLSLGIKAKEFNSYRTYMSLGTIVVGIILCLVIYIFNIFSIYSFEFLSIVILVFIQVLIVAFGSPFALATAIKDEESVKKMAFLLLILATLTGFILFLAEDWRIIIIGFGTLQLVRFLIGYYSTFDLLKTQRST